MFQDVDEDEKKQEEKQHKKDVREFKAYPKFIPNQLEFFKYYYSKDD
jgi:hypothetical protein